MNEKVAAYLAAKRAEQTSREGQQIAEMEREGLIRGYKAVVDWDQLDNTYVSAII